VPGSRLALKSYTTDDPGTMQLLRRRMLRCGLDPERVLWLPTCPTATEHLRQYGLVDVALDPFPNGCCTTSCEALWMGVPLITLLGGNFVSRMGASFLSALRHPDWIATDHDHYRAIARQLASQLPALRQGRAALRQQMASSGLSDLDTYTNSFQKLLRRMWHSHCNGDGSTLLAAEI
jgi:predicted O-linked N-acetylglucosamine transferase (SPINDLY family)